MPQIEHIYHHPGGGRKDVARKIDMGFDPDCETLRFQWALIERLERIATLLQSIKDERSAANHLEANHPSRI